MSTLNEIVTDKIIVYSPSTKQYRIGINKKYKTKIALIFLGITLIQFLAIIPLFQMNLVIGVVVAAIPTLFLFISLRKLFLATNDVNPIIIDLNQRVILYSKTLVLPFKTIKYISKSKAEYILPKTNIRYNKNKIAFQISVEDHRGNKAPLFICGTDEQANKIVGELSRNMNVSRK